MSPERSGEAYCCSTVQPHDPAHALPRIFREVGSFDCQIYVAVVIQKVV